MRYKKITVGLSKWVTLCFFVLLSACKPETKTLSLRLAVNDTYCKQTSCECVHYLASREYDDLQQILKTDYNIELELVYCIEEFYLEDSLLTNNFDGAICKPWFALQYEETREMRFERIVDILDPFENSFVAGIFIVKQESPIMQPEDINGRTLVIGEENSYEKYHAPMHLLTANGIKPGKFKKVSACTEGINALLDNEAEIAVISDYALVASCAADFAEEDAFRTIWTTEDFPLCSVLLDMNKVSRKKAQRLHDALLEISENKIPERFASHGFSEPMPWIPNPYLENKN